jgi:hypothetical protein
MKRTIYRYEVEETRIKAGHCPKCDGRLGAEAGIYFCRVAACSFKVLRADYHREQGFVVMRGAKRGNSPLTIS